MAKLHLNEHLISDQKWPDKIEIIKYVLLSPINCVKNLEY